LAFQIPQLHFKGLDEGGIPHENGVMEMNIAFNVFMIIGIMLLLAAVVTMVFLIYRYITGMRSQGFFGGKREDEKK